MLYRQVKVVDQLGYALISRNECGGKFIGVAGGVTDALYARNIGHIVQQRGKVRHLGAAAHRGSVGVDVLAQQVHFQHALLGQASHLYQHVFKRAAHLFAAGVGHHAVAAVFRAALHDAHKRGGPLHLGRRQVVKLFNFRKADVHLRAAQLLAGIEQVGQAVQGLRAEHHVHIGRAADDFGALLAGHTTAHTNLDAFFLEVLHPSQV